jgi:hypothetical protein
MGKTIDKTISDRTLVLNVREWMRYPFVASGWTDLRVGFFVSLTKPTVDDDPLALAETMTDASSVRPQGRFWLGLLKGTGWPGEPANSFIGFTNHAASDLDTGASALVSSDIGLGTSNAFYWRPNNVAVPSSSAIMIDQRLVRARSPDGVQQHFPQDVAGAGGYCVLLGLQLLRDSPASSMVTLKIKSTGNSADMMYSSAPTNDLLVNALASWPANSIQMGPVQMSMMPDSLFAYWPFSNSRLRIHELGPLSAL